MSKSPMTMSFGAMASAFACALGLVVLAADAQAQVILYEETFPFTPQQAEPQQDLALRAEGWCGGNAGDEFCNNPPPTDANEGGEGAISISAGEDGDPGFAFWSQKGINADSFLYTDEFTFDSSQLTSITWYQRDSGSDPMHLAFLIDDVWYISDQIFVQSDSATWVLQTADLSDLTFFQRSTNGDSSTLPDGGVVPGGLPLPAGQVDAFGFWWDGPKTANSRVDTVTLLAADDDDDGVPDYDDACPASDLSPTVVIDGCDSGVANALDETGCTIADGVAECLAGASNHGGFVSCVAGLTDDFKNAELISGRDKGAIQRCAAQADLP